VGRQSFTCGQEDGIHLMLFLQRKVSESLPRDTVGLDEAYASSVASEYPLQDI
jgi:hypothetical protein